MTTYSAWLAPSSRYPCIFCFILLLTFSYSLSFGLMNRLACFYSTNAPVEISLFGTNPFVLGGFTIVITVLIPNAFLSLFVWNWAFEPLSTRSDKPTEQSTINQSEGEVSNSDDESINEAVDEFSDEHSTRDSIIQCEHQIIKPHFDFTRLSGYRELLVDIYQTIKMQFSCITSCKHTNHPDQLHEHFLEPSVDLSTEAPSPSNYSLDRSPCSSDMSEEPSYIDIDDQLNDVDFSVCLSEYQSSHPTKQFIHSNRSCTNVKINQSINGTDYSLDQATLTTQTSEQVSKQTTIQSILRRFLMLPFLPLIYVLTPNSIYALLMRNFVVDQFNNMVGYLPSNLIFGAPISWDNPFRGKYNAWIVDLLPSLLGTDWFMGALLLCKMSELGNEFLLLPLFYYQKWKHLSNYQSTSQSTRPRSMIWIALLPVTWLIVFGTISLIVSTTSACTLCDDMSGFINFLENWVMPYVLDDRAPFALFGFITLCLIIDQLRHFRGSSIHSHKNCSCRLPYLLLLVLLLSQSAGMSFVFGTVTRIFGEVYNTTNYNVSNMYLLVVFYTSMTWWQCLVRFVALRALPCSPSALAVLFPVQLLEDLFSDLMFASFEPFSAQFFALAGFQIVKTFVRDSDLVSMFILGLSHRVKHRHLPSHSKPRFLAGYHSNATRALNRRVLRHQNFLIEMCAKLVLIAVFLSDSLPFGDNPQWMAVTYGEILGSIQPGVWVYLRTRVWLMGSLLFLLVVQCCVHVAILRFIKYLESIQTSVYIDDDDRALSVSDSFSGDSVSVQWHGDIDSVVAASSSSSRSQQLMDAHWTFHFLFFVVCIFRLIPLMLVITSRELENDGNARLVSQCYNPVFADWY